MASASELQGRRTPTFPGVKSDKTVTFVGPDGNEIEVVSNISKGALRLLKKQGFRKQSEVLREQEEAALAKDRSAEESDDDEDDEEDADGENKAEASAPQKASQSAAKKAAPPQRTR